MQRRNQRPKMTDELISLLGLVFIVLGFTCIFAGFLAGYIVKNIAKARDNEL